MKTKFKEGKIVEIFYAEKKGKKVPVILRYPKKSDAANMRKSFNRIIAETENLNRINPVSMKDEIKWVSECISKMRKGDMILLLGESNGKIFGSASVERKPEDRKKHVAVFGIAILQEFAGLG